VREILVFENVSAREHNNGKEGVSLEKEIVRYQSVSLSLTLTHKLNALRFLVEGGVILLCGSNSCLILVWSSQYCLLRILLTSIVGYPSMSLSPTLSRNEKIEQHIRKKTHKANVLRFWVEGSVIPLFRSGSISFLFDLLSILSLGFSQQVISDPMICGGDRLRRV